MNEPGGVKLLKDKDSIKSQTSKSNNVNNSVNNNSKRKKVFLRLKL